MGSRLSEPPLRAPREPGSLVAARYRVLERLGAGGMGAVYRVHDNPTGQTLALKEFGGRFAKLELETHRLRFRLEFHTIVRLSHPRIVKAFDYGIDGGVPYYTMELLDGEDMGDLQGVSAQRGSALIRDVASALAFLHTRRLIHRDLAPRNVRCTADGRAKLIDFGLLSTAGYMGDIAGTPPLVSPENVRGLPLDHRADLYSLGALAYWLLTGRHAYPARTLDELEGLWRTRPLPPSAYVEAIPVALDELILSLLSLDPLGRPSAAAEVIDRLVAIAGLPPVQEAEVARGYLASAAIVGRQREIQALKKRIERTVGGEGGAVILQAPSGRGKSRLLREVGLEAQVAGATVLSVGSDAAGRGPYGLVRALAKSLLDVAPEQAARAARPNAHVLSRVLPEVQSRASLTGTAPVAASPEEERLRAQAAIVAWFTDVSSTRPLVLLVDDVQRADEASAAVLASLGHAGNEAALLVVAALRTDEAIRASLAVTALSDVAQKIRVRALQASDVEELVRGTFGDVPHLARLAAWMQKTSGGSPLHCFELARHLVERGVVRYEQGVWSVPEEPDVAGMPQRLADAMELRIATLGPRARELAEVLSVHGGALPLLLCIEVADASREEEVFLALDELVYEEVLIGAEDQYRFRHDALREAILRGLAPSRRRELHLRVGRTLLANGPVNPELEAEVGWHLYRGGEREQGSLLLERAGIRLYEAQSFRDSIAPLEAALEVREGIGKSVAASLALRHCLVMAGFFGDRQVALKYGDETIAALARYSGMATAGVLTRFLPRLFALLSGVLLASLRWLGGFRGPSPLRALETFYVEVVYCSVLRSFSFHVPEVRALRQMLDPLRAFSGRIPGASYSLVTITVLMPEGRYAEAQRVAEHCLALFKRDRLTPMRPADRTAAIGVATGTLAFVATLRQDPRVLGFIADLQQLGLRYFDMTADLCLAIYRRLRGEEDLAREIESRLDVLLVQSGSMWGLESQLTWLSALAFGFTRDVLGLRRSIVELTHLESAGFRITGLLDLARGEYLRERGELKEARAMLEHALAQSSLGDALVRVPAWGALAEVALAELDTAAAIDLAQKAIAMADDPEVLEVTWRVRAVRVLALAHAARGAFAEAKSVLEETLDEVAPFGSPSISGSLHEARARVAFSEGDIEAYVYHRRATDNWFRATKNPALIARADRLPDPELAAPKPSPAEHAADATVVEPRTSARSAASQSVLAEDAVTLGCDEDAARWTSAVLGGCRGPTERAARALELLVEASGSAAGYLYLAEQDGSYSLAAPAHGEEPSEAVGSLLFTLIHEATDSQSRSDSALGLRLSLAREGGSLLAGVAILVGARRDRAVPSSLVAQITRALHDAGDVSFGSFGGP